MCYGASETSEHLWVFYSQVSFLPVFACHLRRRSDDKQSWDCDVFWPQPCLIHVVGYLFIFAGTCSCVFLRLRMFCWLIQNIIYIYFLMLYQYTSCKYALILKRLLNVVIYGILRWLEMCTLGSVWAPALSIKVIHLVLYKCRYNLLQHQLKQQITVCRLLGLSFAQWLCGTVSFSYISSFHIEFRRKFKVCSDAAVASHVCV